MYLSRRIHSGAYAVVCRRGLAEILQIHDKIERKTSMNPICPKIIQFGRDYNNSQKSTHLQALKLSNKVNDGKYFSSIGNSINSKMQSSPPNQWFNFPSWGTFVIGSAISLVLSFWNNKRVQTLKQIEGETELAVKGVEAVAEVVEKVATATEEMAKEVAEKLPQESKLKPVVLVLEHISEVTAHEAHLTQDFLHKVEEITQDLDDLEAMIEPLIKDKNMAHAEKKQHQKEEEETKSALPSRH